MTRKQALNIIRVEVAQHGRITREATRVYIENRVSYAAMKEAAREGLEIHTKAAMRQKEIT